MTWLVLVLMALTVYRLTRLIIRDTFPPVLWVRDHLAGGWRPLTLAEHETYSRAGAGRKAVLQTDWSYDPEDSKHQRYVARRDGSPPWLAELFTCPWCASGWIAGAVTAGVDLTLGLPAPWLVGPAVWGAGALLAAQDWA